MKTCFPIILLMLITCGQHPVFATKYGQVKLWDGTTSVGVDSTTGALKISIQDPLHSNGTVPVTIEGRVSESIDLYMHSEDSVLFLKYAAVANQDTLIFASGHGFVAGKMLCILYDGHYTETQVLSVTDTVARITMPISCPVAITDTIHRGTFKLNTDGSTVKKTYGIGPPGGVIWNITGITFHLEDNAAMDDGTFGGITALTKGVFIRESGTDRCDNLFSIKTNGEFKQRGCDVTYAAKPPAGTGYSVMAIKRFGGDHNNGTTIQLDGSNNDELQIIIQDDLTGLANFKVSIHGRVVEY